MSTIDLHSISIAAPCSASWDDMQGDERRRRCASCKLNVYNVAAMTKEEAEALISESEGRVCMRLYRRRDGTILTKDCPTGIGRRRRRQGLGILAALSVLFGVGGAAKSLADSSPSTSSGNSLKQLIAKPLDYVAHTFGVHSLCNCPPPHPVEMGVICIMPLPPSSSPPPPPSSP